MDKLLVVIEEALEAGGWDVRDPETPPEQAKIRELLVTGRDSNGFVQGYVVTVEYA